MERRNVILVLLFVLVTALLVMPVSAGLIITDGEKIISRTGNTSVVMNITETDIDENGTITIDVTPLTGLYGIIARGIFTNANVVVDDTAGNATWTAAVEYDANTYTYILNLTSKGGPTIAGENVIVTFTGAAAGGSAWIPDSYGQLAYTLTATRTDTLETQYFTIMIETTLGPGGLSIDPGAKITETDGATSMVITITDAPILQNDGIIIYVADLDQYVSNGTFTNANVVVDNTADAATWTAAVEYDANTYTYILNLTSTGGPTAVDEKVNVTFTGAAGNAWKAGTNGPQTVILTPFRMDNYGSADFNFVIETVPPAGYALDVDFSATPRSDIAPLSVSFTDKSKGNPTNWSWDFGDGGTSTDQNPVYIYTQPGLYSVTLTVWNEYSIGLVSKTNYINVLNGAIVETDTGINGLTIANCGGLQTITVNTSILPATLSPGKSVLEIQPPMGSGFKNITFYALNGIGFTQNGDAITGDPTRVVLVSEEIAPSSGFSDTVGKLSSFSYSIDLQSYPCNAILSTKIWEGVIPEYDRKLQLITAGQTSPAVSIGTAYTAEITKTNFPSGAQAKIYMSVDSGWNTNLSGGPGDVYIWRIADDGNSGQILPTKFLYTDPVTNLAYYEADSPLGFSTFGISSLTGANNPFQMVALVAAQVVNEGGNIQSSAGSGSGSGSVTSVSANAQPDTPYSEEMLQGGGIVMPAPAVTAKPPALSQPAMSTNVGMAGWLLAIVQNNPIILAGVVGVIAVAAYFGWYKKKL